MRCLIIEDNDGMRELLRQLLTDYCEEIAEARNGEEGYKIYRSSKPDLVIMDNFLPGIDGLETAEKIIEIEPTAHIVMVTDFDEVPYRQAAMRSGIRGFYGKNDLMHLRSYIRFLQEAGPPDAGPRKN
ncbi:response regulator [bacterium]|nr:response regulator [bacterium]